ncbi:diguanylate cyclase [Lysobacter korlensis]|uniref:diguanylate cyclase n=1 Tax=Lysobacter korlensis TaxID=553636 RepID=A0ABV6RH25_9GAMM
MKALAIHKVLLAMALAFVCSPSAVATEYGGLLAEADKVRGSDPAHFQALLDRLVREQNSATEPERRHLRLLQNYRNAIQGNYQAVVGDSIALFDQAPEPELKYRSALLVANVSAVNRDYLMGLRYLDHALALKDAVSDPALRNMGDVVAGTLYNEFGHYELALEQANRLLSSQPDPRNRCIARQIRVRALHGLARAIDEDRDVHDAIADCAAIKEGIPLNAIRSTLAEYWASVGKKQQAVALLEATLPDATATGYTRLVGEVRSMLAQYHLELGDAAKAEAHANAIVAIKGQDFRWLANVVARQVLYQVALQRGDVPAALNHYRLYAEADKAHLDDVKAREYAFQLSRHEVAQKNQSIELLKSQNQLLRLQQEVARKDMWNSRLLIALLVVLAGSLAYWGWRGRRTHRTLRQLAQTDSLTGLSNRRHFRAQSEAALALAKQRSWPISVLLFDLDHFKQINDQCGHATGDWVLREVARVGRLHCRDGNLFGRIGGEEFAMTLIDCDLEVAELVAEQTRRAIAGIDANTVGCTLPVSASIGCVGTSVSGHDYEVLIAHADAAMYRAKVGGRNRVCRYQPPTAGGAGTAWRESDSAEVVLGAL